MNHKSFSHWIHSVTWLRVLIALSLFSFLLQGTVFIAKVQIGVYDWWRLISAIINLGVAAYLTRKERVQR